jgi:hypothetical protein
MPLAAAASDMVMILQETAQHRLAAGAQERHLDAGVGGELVGEILHQRERRRGVPADIAFLDRCGAVGLIGREGLCGGYRETADGDSRNERKAAHDDPPKSAPVGPACPVIVRPSPAKGNGKTAPATLS